MNMKNTSIKRTLKNDIIFIICLLLVAAMGFAYLYIFRDKGDRVKVTVNGKDYGIYYLSENLVKDIYSGNNNEQHNRLIIKDGKAYVDTATCPDGICVNHTPIFRDGESIVCLPNGVVVTVIKTDDNDPDITV